MFITITVKGKNTETITNLVTTTHTLSDLADRRKRDSKFGDVS